MNTRDRMLRYSLIAIVVATVAFFVIRRAQGPATAPESEPVVAPAARTTAP